MSIERNREALVVLQRNIETLGPSDRSTIVRGDALLQLGSTRDASVVLAESDMSE